MIRYERKTLKNIVLLFEFDKCTYFIHSENKFNSTRLTKIKPKIE